METLDTEADKTKTALIEAEWGHSAALTSPLPPFLMARWAQIHHLSKVEWWFSSCAPQTSGIGIPWELVKNAHSPVPPQADWIKNSRARAQESVFTKPPPGDGDVCPSVRTTDWEFPKQILTTAQLHPAFWWGFPWKVQNGELDPVSWFLFLRNSRNGSYLLNATL